MTLSDPVLPYGIRDIRLTPINADGTYGSPVDLPIGRSLNFTEAEAFDELRGDDALQAIHGKGPQVDWSLEAGGISLDAWKILSGGSVATTGSGTTEVKTYSKLNTDVRGYFKIEGQSISDDGGDVHVVIYKCKCDGNIQGDFADNGFFLTKCSGKGLGDINGKLYDLVWNETQAAIAAANNEVQQVIIDATGGTFTLTYSSQTTAALAYNITAAALQTALEALSNIGVNEALVTGAAGGPFRVTFSGSLGGTNVAQMTANSASLTGASAAATVNTVNQGG